MYRSIQAVLQDTGRDRILKGFTPQAICAAICHCFLDKKAASYQLIDWFPDSCPRKPKGLGNLRSGWRLFGSLAVIDHHQYADLSHSRAWCLPFHRIHHDPLHDVSREGILCPKVAAPHYNFIALFIDIAKNRVTLSRRAIIVNSIINQKEPF